MTQEEREELKRHTEDRIADGFYSKADITGQDLLDLLTENARMRELLYRAIVELSYVQEAERLSQCASSNGELIVGEGIVLLGVKDLSGERLEDAPKVAGKS